MNQKTIDMPSCHHRVSLISSPTAFDRLPDSLLENGEGASTPLLSCFLSSFPNFFLV